MLFSKKGEKGFTLIELLVVIAIIGILASIVLVSLNTARSKARDAQRKADLRSIQLAQEMCYDDSTCGGGVSQYAATQAALVTANLLGRVANDPTVAASQPYHTDGGATGVDDLGGGATWDACAQLENPATDMFSCSEDGCQQTTDTCDSI